MSNTFERCLYAHSDFSFVPASAATHISAFYVLIKHPELVERISPSLRSFLDDILTHNTIRRLSTSRLSDFAMIPVCIVMGVSIVSFLTGIRLDRFFAWLSLVAILGSLGTAGILHLPVDIVAFGLLPWTLLLAFLATRVGQRIYYGAQRPGEKTWRMDTKVPC